MQDTKQWILDAAVKLFTEKGYAQTTTRAIAETAGVSESTFFRTYKTKEALLNDLIYIMTPGPEDIPFKELSNGSDVEGDLRLLLYQNAILHVRHLPVFRVAMHTENIYDTSRFSKITGIVNQIAGYFYHLAEIGFVKKFDYEALSEHMNSLVLVKANEFLHGEMYGISVENSARKFADEYAAFFAKLIKV